MKVRSIRSNDHAAKMQYLAIHSFFFKSKFVGWESTMHFWHHEPLGRKYSNKIYKGHDQGHVSKDNTSSRKTVW